jgi:hypothetical protein
VCNRFAIDIQNTVNVSHAAVHHNIHIEVQRLPPSGASMERSHDHCFA